MDKGSESGQDLPPLLQSKGSEVDLIPRMVSSIEPFLLFDEDLNCVSINSAAEKLFRISQEHVVGKNILEVVPNMDGSEACDEYRNVMGAGESSVSPSQFGDLRLNLQAFKVGNGLGVILSDITECRHEETDRNGGYETEQRLDLAGRLVALSEMAGSIVTELSMLADEQGTLERLKAVRRSGPEEAAPDTKATFHSRELSSYLEEFNEVMGQLIGGKERADFEAGYLQMARTLAMMAEAREPYARGHSERVSLLANEVAVWIGCPAELMKEIHIAAILHDVGKIIIPEYILFKPGELTPAEYSEIKRHPVATAEIVRNLTHFESAIPLIDSHHEWYNGMGYPRKLKGDDIHLGARILAVADAYDAMTSPRPYRSRLSDDDAIQAITNGAGTQWDPMIAHAFLEMLGAVSERLRTMSGDEGRTGPGQKEGHSRAEEALQRAEHWAHWMDAMSDAPSERGKTV